MNINEKLGVPDRIIEESKRIFQILIKEVKKIKLPNYKDDEKAVEIFRFDANFGNLKVEDIPFVIFFEYFQNVDSKPQMISAGYAGKSSIFHHDRKLRFKSELKGTFFVLKIACGENLLIEDVVRLVESEVNVSIISHELMHLYDHFKKGSTGIKKNIEYSAIRSVQFPGPLRNLLFLLYFTSDFENTVRPAEILSLIHESGITKKDFLDFLQKSDVIKTLKSAQNFSLPDFKNKLENDPGTISMVKNAIKDGYQSRGSVADDALNLLFINLAMAVSSSTEDTINRFIMTSALKVSNPKNLLLAMLGVSPEIDEDLQKIANDNFKKITVDYFKFKDNPQKYFEMLEKRLKFVGDKMIRKLSKLYDMTPDDKIKESIINWELHQEILKLKGTPIHLTIDFAKFKR